MVGRVSNMQEYFETLPDRLVSEAASGVNASFLYDIAGDGGGEWTVTFVEGAMSVESGNTSAKPTVKIMMKASDYVDMVNGDLDGTKAFMTRKLKVKGSVAMAQKMKKFLPPLAK